MILNHINLTVTDVEAAAAFLEKYFGMQRQGGDSKFTVLFDDQGMVLTLMKGGQHIKYPGMFHIGFGQVSEEKVKAQSKWDFSAYEHAPVPDVDDDNDEAVVEPEAVEPPAPPEPEPEPEPVVEANDNVEMEQRRRMAGMLHRPASA